MIADPSRCRGQMAGAHDVEEMMAPYWGESAINTRGRTERREFQPHGNVHGGRLHAGAGSWAVLLDLRCPDMRKFPLAAAAFAVVLAAGTAQAQQGGTRLRGEVEAMSGSTLMLKTSDGREAKVMLTPGFSAGGVVPAKASDIGKGAFIGVGARPQPDGTLLAVQVVIFPETMRGTGEGHRPWGVLPDATMTNATVADTVSQVDGANLVLSYPGGEQKVTITPDATILMAGAAEASELKPGVQVAMTASRQADGSYSASRITIAKSGAKLPF
ncbi:DUF5666 domain-containing protein [Bosea sp. BH3]|uniref:DUF5666 domain-containing protein n=1 Tax=Bosea sp. BH3 TaxID=2871701 RepID=UPI0021CB0F31|nr:DUF5666 domain-containing protein [Bosea sp. BH3]